jgi:glycosyltransferase involved in cell wall biosynthesis
VIEAMAHGLAVAATAVDGVPEAVVDGETGLLVAAGDAAALGGALVRLLGDAAERRRFGQAGAALVAELFSVERMVDDTIAVYDGLLGEAEGSAQ